MSPGNFWGSEMLRLWVRVWLALRWRADGGLEGFEARALDDRARPEGPLVWPDGVVERYEGGGLLLVAAEGALDTSIRGTEPARELLRRGLGVSSSEVGWNEGENGLEW